MGTIEEALRKQIEFWQQVLDYPGIKNSKSDMRDYIKSLRAAEIRLSEYTIQSGVQEL